MGKNHLVKIRRMFLFCTLSLSVDFSLVHGVHGQTCTFSDKDSIHFRQIFYKVVIFLYAQDVRLNGATWGIPRWKENDCLLDICQQVVM